MSIEALKLVKNDLQPYYRVKVQKSDGTAIDLTGATIYCTMKPKGGTTLKINRQTTGIVITDAANGEFEYRWQAGDTDTTGLYHIEFEINPGSGGKFTVPNPKEGPAEVAIVDSLDST